jgi:uncharacterized protein YqfA (UPF0365 family)
MIKKITEFIIALIIVVLIFKFAPVKFWFAIIGASIFLRVVWFMFSCRNLERQGRRQW